MSRPLLLDLFCGAGGAAMGYHRAGFDVLGVDKRPQPRYPFAFVRADALEFLASARLSSIAAVHASPPCQRYSSATPEARRESHPDLVAPARELLIASGLPWVMENVPGAPLAPHVVLCGTMFGLIDGYWELRRHRIFETSGFWLITPPCQHNGPVLGVYGKARDRRRTLSVTGNFPARETRRALGVYGHGGSEPSWAGPRPKATIAQARTLMGIDWMTTAEICQAIPPAYTAYLGFSLLHVLGDRAGDHAPVRDGGA